MKFRPLLVGLGAAVALAGGIAAGTGAGGLTVAHGAVTAQTTTGSTPVLPTVTTVTTASATTPTALPGYGKPPIKLGDFSQPEQVIIGQLYELALEHDGYTVLPSPNIGTNSEAQQALLNGHLDLYPDWLSSWNSRVARLNEHFDSMVASYAAASAYASDNDFVLLNPTPFSDTWGLAVTSLFAQENHVTSIPDLTRGTGFRIGAPPQFRTGKDGLRALVKAYHLDPQPGRVQGINEGAAPYRWLSSANVTVSWVDTTDPWLATPAYRVLTDPKHVFGFGNIVPVTTPEVVEAEGEAFVNTINAVDALLTLQAIRGLNREAIIGGHAPAQIAEQFLQGNGILPRSRYAPVPTTPSSNGS